LGIRAILFDIDDTLFPSSEFSTQARRHAIAAMIQAGLKATPAQVEKELSSIIAAHGSNFGRHFDLLSQKFSCPDRYRVIAAGIAAYHNTKSSIHPYPHALSTLLSLRERGYIIAVASEGMAVKQWDKLIRLGADHLFHHVFVTELAGTGKAPLFYTRLSRQLGLPPAALLMVGDHPQKDIAAAKASGLRTVRLRSGKHAKLPAAADFTIARLDELLKLLPKKS
jgi:putative hydrolase of the HAD superfamily